MTIQEEKKQRVKWSPLAPGDCFLWSAKVVRSVYTVLPHHGWKNDHL